MIGHRLFAQHMAYAPVQSYSTDNLENSKVDEENERIYVEFNTAYWWWTTLQALIYSGTQNATVIPVLLATDKTVLTEYTKNMAQWPVHLTIGNLSHEIRRSQIRQWGMIVGLIPIHKRDSLEVKMEIYHQTMGVITRCKSKCHILHKMIWLNVTALEKAAIKSLLMMCTDRNVRQCYPIIASISVDYKEQVVITGIKSSMQCSMCQVPTNERENLCKKWLKRTHERTLSQLALQDTEDWIEENGLRHPDLSNKQTVQYFEMNGSARCRPIQHWRYFKEYSEVKQ